MCVANNNKAVNYIIMKSNAQYESIMHIVKIYIAKGIFKMCGQASSDYMSACTTSNQQIHQSF